MRYLLPSLILFVFSINAQGSIFGPKETIVHIGGIAKVLTKSTSCDRKYWGSRDDNACRCCITKHIDKGDNAQKALAYCSKQSKHCLDETIENIANFEKLPKSRPVDPIAFTDAVTKRAYAINEVELNEAFLKKEGSRSGELNNKTAVYFLQKAAQDGFIDDYKDPLIKGDDCIEAKSLSSGGAQTLQLFAVILKADQAKCQTDSKKTIFILKEMKKAKDEVLSLEKIRNSQELEKFLVEKKPTDGFSIALAHQNLLYKMGKNKHYMSLLPTAAGKSIGNYLEDYFEASLKKEANLEEEAKKLGKASCKAGEAIAKFNQATMEPKGGIFGRVIEHGDFHVENVFVDVGSTENESMVTLIDNESMAYSLTKKQPVSQDLIRIYAHSSSRFLGKSDLYRKYNKDDWNKLFFKPFIECYAKAYPENVLGEVKRKLKEIYTTKGIFNLLKEQKTLYNMFQWSSVQSDLAKIIDEIKSGS